MAVIVKITPVGGAEVTVPTAAFFAALNRQPNYSADVITITGVQYTLSTVRFVTTGSANIIGDLDCSANPNYPAGTAGDIYRTSVAGKVGGVNGKSTGVDDLIICIVAGAAGDEAAVGGNWVVQTAKIVNSNHVYVDPVNGIDAEAQKYNRQRPFRTIAAAEAVATFPTDTIVLLPGTYTSSNHGQSGGIYYCEDGVIFNHVVDSGNPIWNMGINDTDLYVYGNARYTGANQIVAYESGGARGGKLTFEFDSINCTNSRVIAIGSFASCYIRGNDIVHDEAVTTELRGTVAFFGSTMADSAGYVNIRSITATTLKLGVVTVTECFGGNLYFTSDKIVGDISAAGGAVISINQSAPNVMNTTWDVKEITNSLATLPATAISHAVNVASESALHTFTVDYIECNNAFDGSYAVLTGLGTTRINAKRIRSTGRVVGIDTAGGILKINDSEITHASGADYAAVNVVAGTLRLTDCIVQNSHNGASSHGISKSGGTLICDDVTVITTNAGVDSIFAGAAQDVKLYTFFADKALNINVTNLIAAGLVVVDTDVTG